MNRIKFTLFVFVCSLLWGSASAAQNVCTDYSLTFFSGVIVKATVADYGKGPVCSYFKFGGTAKPSLDNDGFFVPAIYPRGNCPDGTFDGQLCYLRKAPNKEFLYKDGFYAQKVDGECPFNMVFDGVNCLWRRAAYGTTAISKDGNWYTTLKLGCNLTEYDPDGKPQTETVLGAFDGNVCRVALRPENAAGVAIVQFKDAYYAVSDLPKIN